MQSRQLPAAIEQAGVGQSIHRYLSSIGTWPESLFSREVDLDDQEIQARGLRLY
jgi:hypothetical protein